MSRSDIRGQVVSIIFSAISTPRRIRLVDPNFDPAEPRFVETFRAVLALRDPAASPLKVLEIHTERKQAFSRGNREHHLRRSFELEVPAGTTLRVCFWEQKPGGEKLHARFLLTEQGGLQYDYGLDEAGVGERTIVTLLQHSLWEQICRDYLCESQPDLPAQRRCHYRNTR